MYDIEPVILPSAYKHGVSEDDILHVWRNPIYRFEFDEDVIMLIGAGGDTLLYEVGYVPGRNIDAPVVVHAMKARKKFTERK